jgi:hypothetical protein
MSDCIEINVLDPEITEIRFQEGLINHASTHAAGGSDELAHNSLGGLQGGQSGEYYHLNQSEYTNLVTGSVVRPSETGSFYPSSNPSGFITGVDLSGYVTGDVVRPSETGNFITASQTGAFYPASNPSGFITGVDLSNYATIPYTTGISGGLQTQISTLNNQTGNYVLNSQTGAFYPNSNPSGFITGVDLSSYVTGDVVRPSETGNFITTSQTGAFYPINNPSGFITGVDLSSYATINYTTGVSGDLQGQISTLNNQTGSYVTGSVVRPSETGNFITSSQTGNFYASNNPSGFITGVDLSNYATIPFVTGVSGSLDAKIQTLSSQTGSYVTGDVIRPSQTGDFYPRSNPSGFIGDSGLSGYATIDFTTGISGYLQSQISSGSQTPNSVQNIIGSSLFL